jgi:hypothetical protein
MRLINTIPPPSSSTIDFVHLPRLRSLKLQGEETRVARLLAALLFPIDAMRSISATRHDAINDALSNELSIHNGSFRCVSVRVVGRVFHWIAHMIGCGSDSVAEWEVPLLDSGIAVPTGFRQAETLDLQWRKTGTPKTLLAISAALPFLATLRVRGANDCITCVRSFCKFPAELFPALREWELAGLDQWWHPGVGPAKVTILGELITKALGARKACGRRLLVLRVPAQLSGPWMRCAEDSQLVEKIETV